MKKKFTLIQLFSVVDGRLATEIGDVYEVLNHVCDDNLMTHHLPVASDYVNAKNPEWLQEVKTVIEYIIKVAGSNEFEDLLPLLKESKKEWDVPQLKDDFDTSDFVDYMVENSLLLKRFS